MNNNETLIRKFYTAFQQKDFLTMQSCYHPEATFSDPVFQDLNSKEVKAMWQMLLTASKDLRIAFDNVQQNACHWEAWYSFSKTKRKVHNVIDARFEFKDGLIYRHVDHFSFRKWARQALGLNGWLLGWTPLVRNRVRATARKNLKSFESAVAGQSIQNSELEA